MATDRVIVTTVAHEISLCKDDVQNSKQITLLTKS